MTYITGKVSEHGLEDWQRKGDETGGWCVICMTIRRSGVVFFVEPIAAGFPPWQDVIKMYSESEVTQSCIISARRKWAHLLQDHIAYRKIYYKSICARI